jgi:CHAT domain-containing protein
MIYRIVKNCFIYLCFISTNLFSQNLPLNLYWAGKTDSALVLANKIIANKKIVSSEKLANAYDFLAEYNLEQTHFGNNLKYISLQFKVNKNSCLDSALYFARKANYYNCYIMIDSIFYYCKLARKTLLHYSFKKEDRITLSRYYSYFCNAARNTSDRNINILDSAIKFSDNYFLKALHYRRYATFISDLININEKQWLATDKLRLFEKSISCLKNAESFATKIYPNKKSCLHGSIYKIWSIVLKYRGKIDETFLFINKTKQALIVHDSILNNSDYTAICGWEVFTNMSVFNKTHEIHYLYKNEKILLNTISPWENFYKKEVENNNKGFDDQYKTNPYQKLVALYFQLYEITKNKDYILKCYSLIQFLKNKGNQNFNTLFTKYNQKNLDSISANCKIRNNAVINYFITSNPYFIIAIISLPDTTLMINCSYDNTILSFDFNIREFQPDSIRNNKTYFKKINNILYENYFKKIDSLLSKRNIRNVTIINDGFLNTVNFDLFQKDSINYNSFTRFALIQKYNFNYSVSASVLLNNYREKIEYHQLTVLSPQFNSLIYPRLLFSENFIKKLHATFNVQTCNTSNDQCFLESNQLLQYIGHIKSNNFALEQYLILNDTTEINNNYFFNKNLIGNSYLLNGCGSGIGREFKYDKIYSFPYTLMNQNAHAVICSIWPIDDKENAEFLEKFYNFMANGLSSSDALRKTKLYFAENNYSPSMWGAYVYYGNDFYLTKKDKIPVFFYITLVALVFLTGLVVLIYKKRKLKKTFIKTP